MTARQPPFVSWTALFLKDGAVHLKTASNHDLLGQPATPHEIAIIEAVIAGRTVDEAEAMQLALYEYDGEEE